MIETIAQAHGQVSLLGEHAEYTGGWLLTTPVPQLTKVHVVVRRDDEVHVTSEALQFKGDPVCSFQLGHEKLTHNWIDYLQGGTKILSELGFKLKGFDIHLESNLPSLTELSSTAAVEVSILKSLNQAFGLNLSDLDVAKIGQKIENEFLSEQQPGTRVEQFSCSVGAPGEAILIDTQSMNFERIMLPLDKMDLVVIHSGVELASAKVEYQQRRADYEKSCELLGVQSLREFTIQDLPRLDQLPELLKRRARHIITENERVQLAARALKNEDLLELGKLFYFSHLSMKDDFSISTSEIDFLVNECRNRPETFAARLTGEGFGGSIIALTEKGKGRQMAQDVVDIYKIKTGHTATILVA